MNKEDVIHIYKGILATKKNEILSFVTTGVDPEGIALSEISETSQTETNTT